MMLSDGQLRNIMKNLALRRARCPVRDPRFFVALVRTLVLVHLPVAIVLGARGTGDDSLPRSEQRTVASPDSGRRLGAPREIQNATNNLEIEDLAEYAVSEYNARQGTNLKFKRVVKASEQIVAGVLYDLTLEATSANSSRVKVYEAKVWTKPWLRQKSLEHFKEVDHRGKHRDEKQMMIIRGQDAR